MSGNRPLTVGVISDTHGLLRPEAVAELAGCDLIVHAGDVGRPEVLDELRALAPTHAVRGNVDRGAWAESLPATAVVEAGGHRLYVLHVLDDLDLDPGAAGFSAVISGHTHQPVAGTRRGVLYLDPGSAGPRRFRLPVTVARLRVTGAGLEPETVELRLDDRAADAPTGRAGGRRQRGARRGTG
jgi:putative phosphoesterase